MPTQSSGTRNCRPNWMRQRPKFDSLKLNALARKPKSSQPAIVRIGSMIPTRRRPPGKSVDGSPEVRHRCVEITHTCLHAFRKSMFRTTPKCVLAVVCRWRDWGSMTTANKSKSKRSRIVASSDASGIAGPVNAPNSHRPSLRRCHRSCFQKVFTERACGFICFWKSSICSVPCIASFRSCNCSDWTWHRGQLSMG